MNWIHLTSEDGVENIKRISSISEVQKIDIGTRIWFYKEDGSVEEEGYDFTTSFNEVLSMLLQN